MPINITGANVYNDVPVYIIGNTLSTTDWSPFYSGTSSTVDGYYGNSTSAFNPSDAAQFQIPNGTNGWYSLVGDALSSPLAVNDGLYQFINLQLFSTSNCTVQLSPYLIFTGSSDLISGDKFFITLNLTAYEPYTWNQKVLLGSLGSTAEGCGYLIRNGTSGANVVLTLCDWQATKAKL